MASAHEQYTDEMKKRFGYYATWNPGLPLKLGDIGIKRDNLFTKISDLESVGISFDIRTDENKTSIEHNSQGSVTVTTKLSGTVAPEGSVLTGADAGIIVEFGKKNSTMFKANNTTSPSIKDTIVLGKQIKKLYDAGKWNYKWVIITELIEAESASIIISNTSNGKIELKANANIDTMNFDIADAKFDFSTQFSRGLETKIISEEGLTPLFKIMGLKTRIFLPPIFKLNLIKPFDLLTPETAKTKHKEDIYFSYISDDERE